MKLEEELDIDLDVVAVVGIVAIDHNNLFDYPLVDCNSVHNCMDFGIVVADVAEHVVVVAIDNCHLVTNILKLRISCFKYSSIRISMQEIKANVGVEDHFNEARFFFSVNYDEISKMINF